VTGPGGSNTVVRQITVSNPQIPAPVADFSASPTSGNPPLNVTFVNKSTGQINQFLWDFNGDGITDSTDKDPVHTYTTASTNPYKVRLTVIGPGGQNTKTLDVSVTAPPAAPVADFTADKTSGTAPLTVNFTNTTTGTATAYAWDFNNDGTPDSTTTNAAYTFQTPGTYPVKLTATGAGGSTNKSLNITVTQPITVPVASFTVDASSGTAPLAVKFTSTSTGTIDKIEWDFNGDNTIDNSADAVFTYTFNTAGTFTARLTVTNTAGSNSATQTITVNPALPNPPVASFSANPTSGTAPLTVTFINNSTGTIDKLEWDFNGDGTVDQTSTDPAAQQTFTFNTAGTYNARLTVTNAAGTDSINVPITVNAALPNPPVASFTVSANSGNAPLTVNFTNTSTGQVDSLAWDFNGDGTPDDTSNNTPSFTYSAAGTYTAKLTVTNAGGANEITQTITVNTAPPPPPQDGIVYVKDGELYLMNADGSNSTNITNNGANDMQPSVARDGSKVVFVSNRDGNDEIYTLNLSDLAVQRVTNNGDADAQPSWSPDGNRIVYVSNANSGTNNIYIMNSDGSGATQLTNDGANNTQPSFSGDGNRIIFVSNVNDGNNEIYHMATDGSDVQRLTFSPADDNSPAWSPDNSKIAYVSDANGGKDIYTINPDTSGNNQLTFSNPSEEVEPAWTDDSGRILYTSNAQGDFDVYIMPADGSSSTQLTTDSANEVSPKWRAVP
jgi:PKD repeat protein